MSKKKNRSDIKQYRSLQALILGKVPNILDNEIETLYIRHNETRDYFTTVNFFETVGIDIPNTRESTVLKKVLNKSLALLYLDFKETHPNIKCSHSTFKRRRPSYILLSGSQTFQQCLCEKCQNVDQCLKVLNPLFPERPECDDPHPHMVYKLKGINKLVDMTLCTVPRREYFDRKCKECGVGRCIELLKDGLGERLYEERQIKRWGLNSFKFKDLLCSTKSVSDILDILGEDLLPFAKHYKWAQWQNIEYLNSEMLS